MIDRVRWWKNGDHPDDQSTIVTSEDGVARMTEGQVVQQYRPNEGEGNLLCAKCSAPLNIHGWIDGVGAVHPGDYVLTGEDGSYSVEHPDPMGAALAAAEAAAPPPPEPEAAPEAVAEAPTEA